jgi:D-amino-acid dehydrogenase
VSGVDVAVVGGGIVGTATAAALAEGGASVVLYERDGIAAAASGRNSGAIQHPFDAELAPYWRASIEMYEQLAAAGAGFELPAGEPGLLMVAEEPFAVREVAAELREVAPELEPEIIDADELAAAEPALARGLTACRLSTGIAVPPGSATRAFAEQATRAGASVETGAAARPWIEGDRARGVVLGTERVEAGAVVVAAGPWTDALLGLPPERSVVTPVWGVNVEVALSEPPSLPVEQVGVVGLAPSSGDRLDSIFSLVTAAGTSSLGSTFLTAEPDPDVVAPELVRRGAAFVPALADSPVRSTRACARPVSPDGRPMVGRVPGVDGLVVAAGHGMWGISIGPATARLAADVVLGRGDGVPAALDPARFLGPR